ncbi:hypothetical protein K1T35_48580 (plasmid) [Pseudonocardia sp. DSM 110487]|uniref:hypothetical protein n=1 Tax=Pseudonocardia sp. DSM 110487 TaxID=2865833 RepID=UPI001C6964B1|nr:hypothetical protein [Pseudonocardia sp. DSM 110487]QYN41205.1 hypothetical protein K1T35_48580 [Pseudonocardia sp. DSM 110487]
MVPRIVMTGKQSKLVRALRELLDECGGVEECRRGAFSGSGAQVSTALVWMQRPLATPPPVAVQLDLFDTDTDAA